MLDPSPRAPSLAGCSTSRWCRVVGHRRTSAVRVARCIGSIDGCTPGSSSVMATRHPLRRRICREAHLPAQQSPSGEEARFPCPHEHPCRTRRAQVASRQGARPPLGLIEPIRTRDAFERLRRDGRRVRVGSLWCVHVLDAELSTPHVAFAIGRPVGNAVTRNRLRRRLRALVRERSWPPGWYLVGTHPDASELTFDQLTDGVDRLSERLEVAAS